MWWNFDQMLQKAQTRHLRATDSLLHKAVNFSCRMLNAGSFYDFLSKFTWSWFTNNLFFFGLFGADTFSVNA